MSNTHTHHSHKGPHGPHCEDELRQDVEERREELGHTVEELASRADVKARARTRMRETRQHAEARRAELRGRALDAKQRMQGRTSSDAGRANAGPVGVGSGAYRVDMRARTNRRKPLVVAGSAVVAACAAGVLMHRSGRSPMAGYSMSRTSMAGRAMGGLHKGGRGMSARTMVASTMGGHRMGGHVMKSVRPVHRTGSSKGGSLTGGPFPGGRSAPVGGLSHLYGGHRGTTGGSAMRDMALRKGVAMAGGAQVLGTKVMTQGVREGRALMRAGVPQGGGRSSGTGVAHAVAHHVAPDQGMAHRLHHALGQSHHHGLTGHRH
ncbi:DUF3618 domain-containing protein [Streptomyces sp. MJP52]|uniref:DUF3618 domain-containing protein n=1 Tax=Streptomyces sp. MJP52 TaxID=2940555 RepID=UPI0024755ABD|nr:DUF3618 domain-containing protein [Streptomyces sp. MJP52]MDH6228735.1 hypothetical protein [Streptomyces sp. MJP52]